MRQFELKDAAVDAVALHQQFCDGVVEQLCDRMLLASRTLQSTLPTPCMSQGRWGCSVGSTGVGTRVATGSPPLRGSTLLSELAACVWARDHVLKPLSRLSPMKILLMQISFLMDAVSIIW